MNDTDNRIKLAQKFDNGGALMQAVKLYNHWRDMKAPPDVALELAIAGWTDNGRYLQLRKEFLDGQKNDHS